ncbi:MAG: flavodoxin family protein [Thermotogaceae bacterium]|nr:flavodoxin family protein [Mesotoga sp.]NLX33143.1 flavodoxin family protein [Thermotogaceae bacterium]MDD4039369.1 NAD(P)H-dependent oxidoreductase [Mesotoga sp.]MDD4479486.1 NAD(P)H-dependent oxidoreductase [Mesotoga sp.]MDD5744352.1 NAD(P)H-dependent oxidoreductase [Mesotoga sp.]
MRVTLLNGAAPDSDAFDSYLERLAGNLRESGNTVSEFKLRDLVIGQCIGCWGCWTKTPGECVFSDDTAKIARSAVDSDLFLFASPLVLGFTTSLLKKTIDRMLPLVHPYLAVRAGEIHHRKRYRKYPLLGLLIARESDTDDIDISVVKEIYERVAIELATRLAFFGSTERPAEEVAHEIAGL